MWMNDALWMEVFQLMGEMLDKDVVVEWKKDWDLELSKRLDVAAILGLVGLEKMAGRIVKKTMTTLDLTCYTALYNDARKLCPPRLPKTDPFTVIHYQGITDRLWMVACGFDVPLSKWGNHFWNPEHNSQWQKSRCESDNELAIRMRLPEMFKTTVKLPGTAANIDYFGTVNDISRFAPFSEGEEEPDNSETFWYMKRSKLETARKVLRACTGDCVKCGKTRPEHDSMLCPDQPVLYRETLDGHLIYLIGDMIMDGSPSMLRLAQEYVKTHNFTSDLEDRKLTVMKRLFKRYPPKPGYEPHEQFRPWFKFDFLVTNQVCNTIGIEYYEKEKWGSWVTPPISSHHPVLCVLGNGDQGTYGHLLGTGVFAQPRIWKFITHYATKHDDRYWRDSNDKVTTALFHAYNNSDPRFVQFKNEKNYMEVVGAIIRKMAKVKNEKLAQARSRDDLDYDDSDIDEDYEPGEKSKKKKKRAREEDAQPKRKTHSSSSSNNV